jgi:RHS repeat-associated protein
VSGGPALQALREMLKEGTRRLRGGPPAVAVTLAVALTVSLIAALQFAAHNGGLGGPLQQTWGGAAGRPHRVPAAATIQEPSGGRLVPYQAGPHRALRPASASQARVLPRSRRPRNAVLPDRRPAPVKITSHARVATRLRHPHRMAAWHVRGFDPQTSRVMPTQASADKIVYGNADGTRTAFVFQSPVNYRRADGSWASMNTTLKPAGTGAAGTSGSPALPPSPTAPPQSASLGPQPPGTVSHSPSLAFTPAPSPPPVAAGAGWRQASAAFPETFAPVADAARLVQMPVAAGQAVGFGVAGAARVSGVTHGSTVTYPAVRPGSDLRFVAGIGFVKEQIVLHSAKAPRSWVFPLELQGLAARTGTSGTIEFTDAAGRVRAFVPHGFMTDSNINPHSGDGAYSQGVTYSLITLAGRPAIRMTLDSAWLDSARRVFPVTVDPSVSSFNSTGTTYVMSPYTNDYSSDTEMDAGTYDGGSNVAKSLMKFDVSSLSNDTVLGVRLSLFNSWSYSCQPRAVYVHPVTQSWSVTGNKSYPGPSTGAAIGRKSFATGWVPLGSTSSPCPASWEAINLGQAGTNLVDGWTHGSPNYGLSLNASSTDSYGWKKFTSINNPTGDPFLAITYTPYGAGYKLADKKPVTQITPTQNGKIAVKVTNEGSATWTASNGYELSYRAYDSKHHLAADHPVFTPMPSDVAPGQSVTVDATVNKLPAGSYALDFDMYANAGGNNPVSFSSQGVPPYAVGLYVVAPPPVIAGVYPPSGYVSPTNTPQLSTTPNSGATYQFTLTCQPLPGTTCPGGSISSGQISKAYWTPPPLIWNEPYTWTVTVTTSGGSQTAGPVSLTPEVPQPAVTSRLGGSSGQAFDPQTGDYTTSATDAAVAATGPPLDIERSYNSLDPRSGAAFGAGWSSVLDMQASPHTTATNSSVLVTMADGSQARFGYKTTNTDGSISYIPPFGSHDVLQKNSDGTWTLMVPGGTTYTFATTGTLSKITPPGGLSQTFATNGSGQVTTITDTASGRALHLTWATPTGAVYPHVSSVTTDPPQSGQSGLTWSYSYSGDKLTQVCNPENHCTGYTYGTSLSHFPTAVMDSGPRDYYRLNDPSGSSAAEDAVPVNLGTSDGTYHNVTLGGTGPLAGSTATSASFNGTSGYVSLPKNLITDSTYLSVGLWFKAASGKSGVLFSYQSASITAGSAPHHVPALYIGTDGKLHAEFWNGSTDPMSTSSTVTDGKWHYAVLTAAGTTQSLYLDGAKAASMSGTIDQQDNNFDYIGAGFWSGSNWTANNSANNPSGYFTGSLAEAAVYPDALPAAAVSQQYALATAASPELTQVTLPSGNTYEQAAYDSDNDRLSSYTDPNGGTWTLHLPITTGYKATSDALGEAETSVTVSDPAGRDEVYTYDAMNGGRLIAYDRGAGAGPRTFGYDAAGCLDAVTDEDGNTVTFTNDAHCNVLARSWNNVTGCPPTGTCTTYYSYYGNLANPLDPRNNQLTAVRDGRSSSATDNTYLTSYAYTSTGQLTSTTTPATLDFPNGRTTTDSYSTGTEAGYAGGTIPAGLLLKTTTPGGAVTSYSYYANGDLAQVTEPSGRRTVYTYDNLGRPLTSTVYTTSYPGGLQTSYTYNSNGQPLTVSHPGVTNPVTGVIHSLQESYSYDADGNVTSSTQSDITGSDPPRTTSYTYDDHGQVASVTDPAGATTAYNWDESGNLASKIDADGNEFDYTYNEYNKVTQVTLITNSTDQSNPDAGSSVVLDSYAYDPAGLLASTTDALGRITNDAYDPGERLIAVTQTDASTSPTTGRQTAYGYDNAGNLTSLTRSGLSGGQIVHSSVTTDTIDPADRLTQQTVDPTGLDRATSYSYDADNHTTQATITQGSSSSATSYGYDTAGNRTSQTVHDGSSNLVTTWTYDQNGQPLTVTDPRGNATGANPADYTTTYTYNEAGQLSSVTGPPVQVQTYTAQTPATTQPVTTYGYNTYGDLTQQHDPDNNLTTATYDGNSHLATLTQPAYTPPGSSTPVTAVTHYAYDGLGHLTSVQDPAGNTTSYRYDALGDVTSQTDPQLTGQSAPGTWAWTYDNAGELQSATDPTGAQSQYTWNYFGDQATTTQVVRGSTQPTGTTTYSYDYLGDPVHATSGAGVTTTSSYDNAGELTSTADAYTNTTSYTYNQLGELATFTRPDQTSISYGYDPAGNLTSTTSYGAPPTKPQLDSQSFGYDLDGNLTSYTDGRNHTSTFIYNAASQITSETQPVTSTSSINDSFGYDTAGNPTADTDGRGNTTWTTYNPWNLPESVIEPATPTTPSASDRTYTTSYDPDGRPNSVSQPGGVNVTGSYDQLGDLTQLTGSGAEAATPAQNYGYDLDGRLTSATAPGGTDTFTWNDAGNVTATSGPSGTASFTYNADGQMLTRADAAGTTSYTYDQAGRLATLSDPGTSATLSYGYTANSQPATISYATGGTQGPTQTLTYTPLQQLATDTLTTPGGATIALASYGYDNNGNLTSQTTTGYAGAAATTYGYDQANRLTSATTNGTTTSYSYDPNSNLTQAGITSYSYDARNQLTSSTSPAGTTSYTWTPRGTLDTITPPTGSTQTSTYNAYGQLATAPSSISYTYDALGRLATRTSTTGTQDFSYSGTSDTLASDNSQTYTYDPTGNPIGVKPATGPGQSLLTNSHSDITGLFSPAASTTSLTGSTAYSPYGAVTASTGTSSDLGYQGQWTDPSTSQTSMGARWYNPTTSAFTSHDTWNNSPIPNPANANPYAYADGNPLTNIDPTGHLCQGAFSVVCDTAKEVEATAEEAGAITADWASVAADGLGAAFWAVDAYFFPTPTASGCYDVLCPIDNYPWHHPTTLYPYGADYNSGGSGASPGECIGYCYPPPQPPPPPPPPQDIYAGPNPAAAPTAPKWMRTRPYITQEIHDVTNAKRLLRHGPNIIEHNPPQHHGPINGLAQLPGDTTSPFSADNDLSQEQLGDVGNPAPPAPATPTISGPGEGGGGGPVVPLLPPVSVKLPQTVAVSTGGGGSPAPSQQEDRARDCFSSSAPSTSNYGPIDTLGGTIDPGRATSAEACLAPDYRKNKGVMRIYIPGFDRDTMHRAHLLAARFGGTAARKNRVPFWPGPNTGKMFGIEEQIAAALAEGQRVYYYATPNYPAIPDGAPNPEIAPYWPSSINIIWGTSNEGLKSETIDNVP